MRFLFTLIILLVSLNASANVGAISKWNEPLLEYAAASYLDGSLKLSSSQRAEVECLSKVVFFEARGEKQAGQIMVANVVLNRMKFGKPFSNTICGVVYQPHQFSWTNVAWKKNSNLKQIERKYGEKQVLNSLKIALYFTIYKPKNTGIATHFSSKNDKFKQTLFVFRLGNHNFYRYLGNA